MKRLICLVTGHRWIRTITGVRWDEVSLLFGARGVITGVEITCLRCGRTG